MNEYIVRMVPDPLTPRPITMEGDEWWKTEVGTQNSSRPASGGQTSSDASGPPRESSRVRRLDAQSYGLILILIVVAVESSVHPSPNREALQEFRHESDRATSTGRFLGMGRDDPELDFALDVLGQVDLDRVEAQLLERPFDPDVLGLDREALVPKGLGDLIGVDRAVEMSLGVGVGLDRERALGDLGGQVLRSARRASSSSLSRWRCFSTIRRLFWVANVASPCGTR